ncbi:MAG: S9 family peptidase [Planctomycetota bacterium]
MSEPLTFEEVATYPLPGTAAPTQLRFSPDGGHLTYLFSPGGSLVQELFACEVEGSAPPAACVRPAGEGDTEENLSLEEKLRRERLRERGLGVTRYAWARRADRLVIPLSGAVYVQDGVAGALRELLPAGDHPALDPRLSPDGEWLAYVQDAELYVVTAAGGAPRQLTSGARGTGRTHGLADYIAEEEMHRHAGYWWSRDARHLAVTEVDDTHIPVYRIVHQGKDQTGEGAQEDHRYPFAGQPNPRVKLGVVAREGGEVAWLDLGDGAATEYLARVSWLADGRLAVQTQDRAQRSLRLLAFTQDPASGAWAGRELLREETAVWINLHDCLRSLEQGEHAGRLLWASERTGFQHLYLLEPDGRVVRALTAGEWQVDELCGVDEARGLVYFSATKDGPTEKHLYAVPLAGGAPRRITREPGYHQVVLDDQGRHYADLCSTLARPPRLTLRALEDDRELRLLYDGASDPRVARLGLEPPELVSFETEDGVTLHGALYRPASAGPAPLVVSVYGGPHAQRVVDHWSLTVDLRAQLLRQRGFLVLRLDNRGSARRGLAFEGAIRHDLGHLEVEDQVAGVRWLAAQGLADPARVGIYGWSYGGYLSLMALARAPHTFRAAVSGAPVTHWDGYDTHYTERYMGTPQENPEGYRDSSVMAHMDAFQGALLLVHGLLDENVHFRHTARLINALHRAGKPYELLLFPDERHMPRGLADRVALERRLVAFFERELA